MKLTQPGPKTVNAQGIVTVGPLPPPPATRDKSLVELAQDLRAAQVSLGAAQTAYTAAGTLAGKADALRDAVVALAQGQRAIAKVVRLVVNDEVPNARAARRAAVPKELPSRSQTRLRGFAFRRRRLNGSAADDPGLGLLHHPRPVACPRPRRARRPGQHAPLVRRPAQRMAERGHPRLRPPGAPRGLSHPHQCCGPGRRRAPKRLHRDRSCRAPHGRDAHLRPARRRRPPHQRPRHGRPCHEPLYLRCLGQQPPPRPRAHRDRREHPRTLYRAAR
jgi:hypothetical protein